jgi:AraC family transcriptional regulator, regulatory protein of adaptative response / methylated-DNA-[protein]-cysteine methyltransferase
MSRLKAREFERIATALAYIEAHWREQPSLEEVAAQVHLSPFHFNRLFHQWAGITPKAYMQFITGSVAKAGLRQRHPVLSTALRVGLSGGSRLHDLILKLEAMSPAQYANGGAGLRIEFGVAPTPFGLMLAGQTERGLCHLSFVDSVEREAATRELRAAWPAARLRWNPDSAAALSARIWPEDSRVAEGTPLRLLVKGSQFQLKVWQALLSLDAGEHVAYGDLARRLQRGSAARAVGSAVGANRIAWLIPCHRVLRAGGKLGGYHWGVDRKRAMLTWEKLARA